MATILRMPKRTPAQRRPLLVISFLLLAFPMSGQNIKIEVVNLTWTVGVGHIPSSFQAKAKLPDGSHATLLCQGGQKECAGFQSFASENLPNSAGCDREHMVVTCTAANLGYFPAQREGDNVLIFVPNGKRKCRIVGSW